MTRIGAASPCRACGSCGAQGEVIELLDVWHDSPGRFVYRTCATCGSLTLVSADPSSDDPAAGDGEYYTHAPASPARRVADVVLLRRRRAAAEVRRLLGAPVPATVLDFGCGAGDELAAIASGRTVVGIEPDPTAAANARSKGLRVLSDASELAASERFGVVTARHVLEHVDDPAATLAQLVSLTAPGGHVIVVTPNAGSLGRRVFGRSWRGYDAPRHRTIFTLAGVEAVTRTTNVSVTTRRVSARHSGGIAALSLVATPVGRRVPKAIRYPLARVVGALYGGFAKIAQLVDHDAGDEIVVVVRAAAGSTPRSEA